MRVSQANYDEKYHKVKIVRKSKYSEQAVPNCKMISHHMMIVRKSKYSEQAVPNCKMISHHMMMTPPTS
jgi:hypothetical protein